MIDIGKLQAGRELDALVAELVLDFHWEKWETGSGLYDREGVKRGKRFLVNGLVFEEVPPMGHEAVPTRPLPSYSIYIAEAWKVVESIFARTGDGFPSGLGLFKAGRSASGEWGVELGGSNSRSWVAQGDTVPLAICRAALKAVGADR